MAVTKLGNSKSATNSINYCVKKAVAMDGVNCIASNSQEQFKATRNQWGKIDGVQVHTIIQSFEDNITPQKANEIGVKLAEKLINGHEIAIFTHTDTNHIHNHIIINAVNFENGKKYQSTKDTLRQVRNLSDEICFSYGLSNTSDLRANIRYTLSEREIIQKGQSSWKDELRQVIDFEKTQSKTYSEFKTRLKENYNIETNDKRKHITFKHPDNSKVVRGKTLGADYEREEIENVIIRKNQRENNTNRTTTSTQQREQNGIGEQPTQRSVSNIERTVRGIDKKIKSLTSIGRAKEAERQQREQEIARRAESERIRIQEEQRIIKQKNRGHTWGFER